MARETWKPNPSVTQAEQTLQRVQLPARCVAKMESRKQ
jgi:hypothetical protein